MPGATKVVGNRVGAFLIDVILFNIVQWTIFFSMAQKQSDYLGRVDPDTTVYGNFQIGDDKWSIVGGDAAIYFLVIAVLGIGYFWILPGVKGWSIGKLICQIRIVKAEGGPPGIGRNIVRQLMWIVDDFPYIIPGLTAFIVALCSKGNQRVGDMVAKTWVVRKEAFNLPVVIEESTATVPAAPPQQFPVLGTAPPTAPQQPVAPTQSQSNPPANWYPDPKGEKRLRYWDGNQWTDHTAD